MKILPNNIAVLDESLDCLLSRYVEAAGRLDYDLAIGVHYLPLIRPGMVVIDAGAAIGDHTIAYANIAGPQNVHAFECSPYMLECLRHNCPGCNIYDVALSDHEGETHFHQDCYNAGASHCADSEDGIVVRCATLDSFGIKNVGLIKWDLEGMEIRAMRGARQTIMAYRPIMMCEFIPGQLERDGGSADKLYSILTELGYSWQMVRDTELQCNPK